MEEKGRREHAGQSNYDRFNADMHINDRSNNSEENNSNRNEEMKELENDVEIGMKQRTMQGMKRNILQAR